MKQPVPPGVRHGLYAYTHFGCRCTVCVKARSDYCHRRRHPLISLESDPGDPRHGTRYAYVDLGCRCARCREAVRLYGVARREEVKRLRREATFDEL